MEALAVHKGVMRVSTSIAKNYAFQSGWQHDVLGDTWKVNEDGSWYLPERTLGWEFIEFASRWYLDQTGKPFVLTDEQLRLSLWLYELDESGSFANDLLVIQRLKG